METITDFWVAIKEGDLAPNDLNKTHLKADFSHSKGKVGSTGKVPHKSIASVFRTVNYLYLHRVLNVIALQILNYCENAVRVLVLFSDYLPKRRVDGRPSQPLLHLKTDFYLIEF